MKLRIFLKELSLLKLIIWEHSKFSMALHFTKNKGEFLQLYIPGDNLTFRKEVGENNMRTMRLDEDIQVLL